MIFELPDIFFGSHKKRKGITTTAGETVRIYKKGRKSLTTSGFFKKSGDIFFGATSQVRVLEILYLKGFPALFFLILLCRELNVSLDAALYPDIPATNISKSAIDFFKDKSESKTQKYIDICRCAEKLKE